MKVFLFKVFKGSVSVRLLEVLKVLKVLKLLKLLKGNGTFWNVGGAVLTVSGQILVIVLP